PLLALWGRGGAISQLGSLAVVLTGAGLLTYAAAHQPWSARYPRPVQAFHLQDAVEAKAYRASGLEALDPWSAGVVGPKPERRRIAAL
ncbi:hypothetical protein ABTN33_19845, partial [Acinetobacter baumannii]